MGGFEDALNSILSSPKDMEKILGLARELSGSDGPAEKEEPPKESPQIPGLGDLDPRLLGVFGKIMGELRHTDDGKAQLMASLKPYVRPERREVLDKAVKIARFARVARVAMQELGGDFDFGL